MTANALKQLLGLVPLPGEGGFYAETYRAARSVPAGLLPPACGGARSLSTAIFYLLTPDTCSILHRLPGDEVYHFYLGDPVELVQLHPDGRGEVTVLGHDLPGGMKVQCVVPGGVWQGARLRQGGDWALMGTTMAPGFAFEDFEAAERAALLARYPPFADRINALTR